MYLVFLVNPILATGGQIAAIVIGFYVLVFVLLALVFNVVMAVALAWIREKTNMVKMLRPTVEGVNKTTEAAIQGIPPEANENAIVRTVAKVPVGVQTIDKQVDKTSERVASTVIEVYARAVQAKAIARAFLLPGLVKRDTPVLNGEKSLLNTRSPGTRTLREKHTRNVPAQAKPEDNHAQPEAASQLSNVLSR